MRARTGSLVALVLVACGAFATDDAPQVIRLTGYTPWAWNAPTRAARKSLQHWLAEEIDPVTGRRWGQLIDLQADNPLAFPGFSLKLLNFAAGTGEEVITSGTGGPGTFFRYRDQRFLLPLNPFIWRVRTDAQGCPRHDAAGRWDYELDAAGRRQLLWPDWDGIPAGYRSMLMDGEDVVGLPLQRTGTGLLYRRDLFTRAGLDPDAPPRTWDAVFDAALKLAALGSAEKPVYGIYLDDALPELYALSQGGEVARKYKSGAGGQRVAGRPEDELLRAPDGTDLRGVPERWEATFDTPEYAGAVRFVRKLTLVRWIVTRDKRPIVAWLPDTAVAPSLSDPRMGDGRWEGDPRGTDSRIVFADGTVFSGRQIRTGVSMGQLGTGGALAAGQDRWYTLFFEAEGRLGLVVRPTTDLTEYAGKLTSDQFGFAALPAGGAGIWTRAGGRFGGLNYSLLNRPEDARRAWALLSFLAGERYRRLELRSYVNEGLGRMLDPRLLNAEGYATLAEQVPPSIRAFWSEVERQTKPAIYAKNFQPLSAQYLGPVLSAATRTAAFDVEAALADANRAIQARLDFDARDASKIAHRPLVVAAVLALFAFVAVFAWKAFRTLAERGSDAGRLKETAVPGMERYSGRVAGVLLLPALLLISLFSYYPILKALPIAFQDYRVTGLTDWVGMANFVEVFRNPKTWVALLHTAYYLGFAITVGFAMPVVLAVLLSEIKAAQQLLRTIYYLPAVIAGIVMLLLWQKLFEPTDAGLMNRLAMGFAERWNALLPGTALDLPPGPYDWLHHRLLGIPVVVFIGIWGQAGPGTLVYLAALKSIPEDLYEAAELDGAGWRARFWHITLSYLRPLLVINFIGAVIGAFHASGNILALTGNTPATYTFAVHLWFEAFGLGNFGVATALSWFMAALLIVFTVWQFRLLKRIEFRRASAE